MAYSNVGRQLSKIRSGLSPEKGSTGGACPSALDPGHTAVTVTVPVKAKHLEVTVPSVRSVTPLMSVDNCERKHGGGAIVVDALFRVMCTWQ